jgi:hypothetical protein
MAAHAEVRQRRAQLRHPIYDAPELLARRPKAGMSLTRGPSWTGY